jgi:aryl-alcohol dehydrogenase-like predicted oxidoreductase
MGDRTMKTRRFGRTGWEVGEIGFGMWGMGGWTGSDDEESMKALDRAIERGCNFFDTALAYGEGRSERLLGNLLRAHPDRRLYTATKVPPKNRKWPSRRGSTLDDCYPPDYIRRCVEESLEHAGVDSFDLMQFHVWEDDWVDDRRWFHTMDDLRSEGLIRAIGLSLNRWEPWNGIRTVRAGLVDAVQVIYNIFDQAPEDELFPACREMDVAVIARVPFDEGTLTGTLTRDSTWPKGDWRNLYFVQENLVPSVERAERLRPDLPDGLSMPEAALRFILAERTVSTIIPGMRKPRHVDANCATSDAGPLPADVQERLRAHRWDRQPTAWSL